MKTFTCVLMLSIAVLHVYLNKPVEIELIELDVYCRTTSKVVIYYRPVHGKCQTPMPSWYMPSP